MADRNPNRSADPGGSDWLDELFSPARPGWSGMPDCGECSPSPVIDTCAYLAGEMIGQYTDPSGRGK